MCCNHLRTAAKETASERRKSEEVGVTIMISRCPGVASKEPHRGLLIHSIDEIPQGETGSPLHRADRSHNLFTVKSASLKAALRGVVFQAFVESLERKC
jgi:hypothetical protein